MKNLIKLTKIGLNLVYNIFKLRKINTKKVLLLSRQQNEISLDYKLLRDEFIKRGYTVKVINYKLEPGIFKKILYIIHIINVTFELSNTKICIVDGYSIPISVLKHKEKLIILQLWHALGAIKKFGYQTLDKPDGNKKEISLLMDMHKNYTYLSCASNVTKEYFCEAFNIEKEKIVTLGMPRVDYLMDLCNNQRGEIYEEYPFLKKKKTIVYVPTFRKNKSIDFNSLIKKIDKKKYNLIIQKHPLDVSEIPTENLINNKYNTYDILSIADYIITDYSATGIEASILNKPLYFYLYDYDEYIDNLGVNIDLFKEMKDSSFKYIDDLIKSIELNNYNYKELEKFKNKYIETTNVNNTKSIIDFVTKE